MSTSVYLGMNGTEITSTKIPESSIRDTPRGALLQPVVIYVERVVAKVRVRVNAASFEGRIKTINGNTAIALVDAEGEKIMANDKQVYAMFSNWNLTGTTSKSWLNKHINPAWEAISDFDWTWNYPTFFRSFGHGTVPVQVATISHTTTRLVKQVPSSEQAQLRFTALKTQPLTSILITVPATSIPHAVFSAQYSAMKTAALLNFTSSLAKHTLARTTRSPPCSHLSGAASSYTLIKW